MKASLNKIETVKQDVIALKAAIHVKNTTGTVNIDGQEATASEVLESLNWSDIVNNLRTIRPSVTANVLNGVSVGIVEEGLLTKQKCFSTLKRWSDSTPEMMLIDKFNSTETEVTSVTVILAEIRSFLI